MFLSGSDGEGLADIVDLGIVDDSRMFRARQWFDNGTEYVRQFRSLSVAMGWCEEQFKNLREAKAWVAEKHGWKVPGSGTKRSSTEP